MLGYVFTFNRTRLELKQKNEGVLLALLALLIAPDWN